MKVWLSLVGVVVLCLQAPPLLAEAPAPAGITLALDQGRYVLGRSVEVLEDVRGDLSFEQVRRQTDGWQPGQTEVLNFSFSDSVYWVRTVVYNPTARDAELLLELAFPLQDYVDVFVETNAGGFDITRTGDRRDFATRAVAHHNFLFPVDVPAGSERRLYVRFGSEDGLHEAAPLTLWRKVAFAEARSLSTYVDGLLFGFMLVMLLYNFFLFVALRDPGYFFYVLFLLAGSFWFFAYQGLAFRLLWPRSPTFANVAISVSVCLLYATHLLFARFILETRRATPRSDLIIRILAALWFVLLLYSTFGSYRTTWLMIAPAILATSLFVLSVGVGRMLRGHRPARYYVLAFLPPIVGVPVVVFKLLGQLPSNPVTENAIQFAFAGSVIVFALGLADRINVIREEQRAAQAAALEKEAEARRVQERAAEDLRRMDRLKDAFLANTSHELRTPLNGIIGLAQSLMAGLDHYDNDRITQQLALISHSGQRLAHLVNDILDLEKLRGGDITLHLQNVDLRTTADVVLALVTPEAEGKGLELFNKIPADTPPVYADEARLEQILHNLVGNAVRYTDRGRVSVGALVADDGIEVFVQDTGPGIPPESQADIFEEFRQLENAGRRPGGTGLGLSISRRLARLFGSDIALDSVPGQGARFSFRLPPAEQGAGPGAPGPAGICDRPIARSTSQLTNSFVSKTAATRPAGKGQGVILLVDDEEVNLEVMRSSLELEGYVAVAARSADEAQAYIAANPRPDLVVLDIMMPQVSGLQLAAQLRETHSLTDLPICMVTARIQTEDLMAALEAGANDYLTKPFEREEFLLRVRNLISLSRTRRDAARRERERIIADLHDHLGATLTDLHFLGESAQDDAQVAPEFAARMQSMVGRAVGELRADLLGLEDLDLLEQDLIGGFNMVVLRRYVEAGREVDFVAPEQGRSSLQGRVGPHKAALLYSVVREIVTNDLKYGSGQPGWSFAWTSAELAIGFRSLSHYRLERHGAGRGTAGIVRRLAQIGGTIRMTMEEPHAGTEERPIRIEIRVPLLADTKIP